MGKLYNFVMSASGRLSYFSYGQTETVKEFIARYEEGEYELSDESEVETEELFIKNFNCPQCKTALTWVPVRGPKDKLCQIKCVVCSTTFVLDESECNSCSDYEPSCVGVMPAAGL
jgi:hypothetical protein